MNLKQIKLALIALGAIASTQAMAMEQDQADAGANQAGVHAAPQNQDGQNAAPQGEQKAEAPVKPGTKKMKFGFKKHTAHVNAAADKKEDSKEAKSDNHHSKHNKKDNKSANKAATVVTKEDNISNKPAASFRVPEENGQWTATYTLNNGAYVTREMDKLVYFDGQGKFGGRSIHFGKGLNMNGRTFSEDINLTTNLNQDDFIKEVEKLGKIQKVTAL